MTQSTVAGLATRLEEAQKDFLQALRNIPPSVFSKAPSADDWTVAQVVGHAAEIQTFWVGQAESIAREDNPLIGRLAEADKCSRSHSTGEGAPRDPRHAVERFDAASTEALRRLRAFRDADLLRQGHRLDGKLVGAGQLIEDSVISHVAEHARQLQKVAGAPDIRTKP
ncbi:MAG: DinB family protein [Dehalococcoidia bacterium]|nr:DinB family protein [Dehalococcoidia bacterium]